MPRETRATVRHPFCLGVFPHKALLAAGATERQEAGPASKMSRDSGPSPSGSHMRGKKSLKDNLIDVDPKLIQSTHSYFFFHWELFLEIRFSTCRNSLKQNTGTLYNDLICPLSDLAFLIT